MDKILPFLVIGILVVSGIGASSLGDGVEECNHTKKTLSMSNLHVLDRQGYINLEIDEANSVFIQSNYYVVPTHIETFIFPFNTKIHSINVVPRAISTQKLEKKLKVAPEPVLMDSITAKKENNDNIKPRVIDFWYNYDVGAGIYKDESKIIVKIQVFPVQYHPEDDAFDFAEKFDIDIKYSVSKPKMMQLSNDNFDLLIISVGDYTSELEDLVQHKINRGISTKLVILFGITNGMYFPVEGRDVQEQIKYFIKNAVEQWGTRYVLFVGGSEQIPVRMTHVFVDYNEGDDEIFMSDLYYADIYDGTGDFCSWDSNGNDVFGEFNWTSSNLYDDVDLYPDVYLGRLACISGNQVTTCVNKIITYETTPAYTQDWFSEMILCGGDSAPEDEEGVDEGEYICDIIEGIMTGFTATKLYANNGGLNTVRNMKQNFNRGSGWLVLSGHANPTSWATHPHDSNLWLPPLGFSNNNALRLENDEKLPILLTDACSPFKFNVRDDCIGWNFMVNPDGGAIGGFGATGLSWFTEGYNVSERLTAKIMIDTVKAYKNEGAITLGEMWSTGVNPYIHTDMDGGEHKSIEEWQLLGDPSLAIAEESQAPLKPNPPNGPSSGQVNVEKTYTASSTDPDGDDLYYMFDWGDYSNSGWLGPYSSGDSCEASHIWTTQGSYQIKVKAKDSHGVQSEWSDPLSISMSKAKVKTLPILVEKLINMIEGFPRMEWLFDILVETFPDIA